MYMISYFLMKEQEKSFRRVVLGKLVRYMQNHKFRANKIKMISDLKPSGSELKMQAEHNVEAKGVFKDDKPLTK